MFKFVSIICLLSIFLCTFCLLGCSDQDSKTNVIIEPSKKRDLAKELF